MNSAHTYIDSDNDKIIILDYKSREDSKEMALLNEKVTMKVLDKGSFFGKKVPLNILEDPKIKYESYTIIEGDTWESVATKLFGSEDYSPKLKIWNQDLLKDIVFQPDEKIRYIKKSE